MKTIVGAQPDSLYSMAFCDADAIMNQGMMNSSFSTMMQQRPKGQGLAPIFYPVDEYKDMSLPEILDITDDFVFGGDDSLVDVFAESPPDIPSSMSPPEQVGSHSPMPEPAQSSIQDREAPLRQVSIDSIPIPVSSKPKKRQREEQDSEDSSDDEGRRFRPYQAGQW